MLLKLTEIKNEQELISLIDNYLNTRNKFVFRGHPDSDYKLLPNAGRKQKYVSNYLRYEKELISSLQDFLRSNNNLVTKSFDLQNIQHVLTFAQHYQFKTRLLDWTKDIRVALHFAFSTSDKYVDKDKAIWILTTDKNPRFTKRLNRAKNIIIDDLSTNNNQRVQKGLFIRHVIKKQENRMLPFETLRRQRQKFLEKVIIRNNVPWPSFLNKIRQDIKSASHEGDECPELLRIKMKLESMYFNN